MESGINKKVRVIWLCHFANQEMIDYFGISNLNEFAPWIDNLINLFKMNDNIELHIIAPNIFNYKDYYLKKDNITYHFYKTLPFFLKNNNLKKVYSLLKIEHLTNYKLIKNKIKKLINKINPDIIHLHGAENPYYSSGILPIIGKYPILITIQGFVHQSSEKGYVIKKRVQIEKEIIKKCINFGVRTEDMNKIISKINTKAIFYFHNYPLKIPSIIKNNIGKDEPIDCIYFARVCKDKGIEDLLSAVSILKQSLPNISLSVIGGTNSNYMLFLKEKCQKLNITDNVNFIGFLPTQEDVYNLACMSKVCVLPTYHDIIPGTIVESMYMKLPVVTYSVGGIPELNILDETVILVDKFNISNLASSIMSLLNDVDKRKLIAEKAFLLIHKKFNNDNIVNDILVSYENVINSF